MAELRLLVLHYHLWPGGVTSVIRDSLVALDRYGSWNSIRVKLLIGSPVAAGAFLRQLEGSRSDRLKAEVEILPALAYRSRKWPSRPRFEADVGELSRQLEEACHRHRAQLLWAHNPTLGKNPAVTAALSRLVRRQPGLRVLFHLHDFAECGRPANLEALRRCYPGGGLEEIYPSGPALTLVTLTESARQRLLRAGFPEQAVAALPDPVVVPGRGVVHLEGGLHLSREERQEAEKAIIGWSRRQGYSPAVGKKWLLSPVRAIRRKNLLETILLKQLLGGDWNLLITLDCNSAPERPYAELVKECLRREQVQGTLGFGAARPGRLPPYERLYASAEAVATTAVLEGFGLVFAESTLFGRPLLGRDLPDVTEELEGLPRSGLYPSLAVPLKAPERKRLLELYRQRVSRFAERTSVGEEAQQRTAETFEVLFTDDQVDFSYLDLPAQARAIHALRDTGYRSEVEKANPALTQLRESLPAAPSEEQQRAMADSLGLESFAHRFQEILEHPPGAIASPTGDVSKRLCEAYFQPAFLRLLLDAGDAWRLWEQELIPRFVPAGKTASEARARQPLRSGTRAVLWDVYGTLLVPEAGDLEHRLRTQEPSEPFLEAMAAAGFDTSQAAADPVPLFHALIEADHMRSRTLGLQQPEVIIETIWQRLIEQLLPGQWATLEQARFAAAYYELATNRITLRPGVQSGIETLSREGYSQGILSNSQFYTPVVLKHALGANAWAAFEPGLLFWSYQLGAAKPDPAPFAHAEAALRAHGIESQHIYLIGDSLENDIAPARARGWKTILLDEYAAQTAHDKRQRQQGNALPDKICKSAAEILDWLLGEA